MVKCLVCSEFQKEAKRYAGNNRVYLADGVRCDGKKTAKYCRSFTWGATCCCNRNEKTPLSQWSASSSNHLCLRTLNGNDPNVIQTLSHMAVDVYNDSKLLTSAAWSWPSRSLAQLHAVQDLWK